MLPTPSKESSGRQAASAVYRRVGGGRNVGLLAAVLSHNHKENVVHPTGQSNEQQPTHLTRRSKMQKELNAASWLIQQLF